MSDLISRQAAIDAVEFGITYAKAIDVNTGESKELFKEGNDALKKAVERLKELPSAEPEPQWIPCSERLPNDVEIGEEYPMVIFCTIDETYYGFLEYTEHGRTWWSGDAEYQVDEVVAWMPLPKPYGGEQE